MSWVYQDSINRGNNLLTLINAPYNANGSGQSQWTSFADLNRYGWFVTDNQSPSPQAQRDIDKVINDAAHGMQHLETSNRLIRWAHNELTIVNSVLYYGTGASYAQLYNLDAGCIFATSIWGPKEQGTDADVPVTGNPHPFPPLRFWSDVTYLQWADLAEDANQLKRLERVVHCDISNATTQAIIKQALTNKQTSVDRVAYPGVTFLPSDGDDFKALLGCPNAWGTGYLLAQHKAPHQLGHKEVKSISVFCTNRGTYTDEQKWAYAMVINIGDKQ
jgi:hypothetical protein